MSKLYSEIIEIAEDEISAKCLQSLHISIKMGQKVQ